MSIRARLAPTPSGFLHYGNLFNFVLTWIQTRRAGGVLALRIDDLDATRARPEYTSDIFTTLRWLGFDWDEGPQDEASFTAQYSQSLGLENYREFRKKFLGYACDCSRQTIKSRTDKFYDGHCRERQLSLTKDVSQWRVKESVSEHDVVLWRKDDLPAYHLVSLYEDLKFGTNLIIRGADLAESTEAQLRLAQMLGDEARSFIAAQFIHHPLLLEGGEKMSKSTGSQSLKWARENGMTPSQVFQELSRRAQKKTINSLNEALLHW